MSQVKFQQDTYRTTNYGPGPMPNGPMPQNVGGGMPGMPGGMQNNMPNMPGGMQNNMPGMPGGMQNNMPGMPRGMQNNMPGGAFQGQQAFQSQTFQTQGQGNGNAGAMRGGKDESWGHKLGEAMTGGETKTGYLAAYLDQLQSNPLRTKMLTSASLAALQEVLASWIAKDRSKHGHYFNSRVPKMALYGAFISAPMGHFLIKILQKVFENRTSLKAKILQILVSNLIIAPIQNSIYLVSMAVIAGARTFHQIRATVRAGFWPVMKVSWITSPIALAFAQKFLPEQAWVPFFNFIAFVIGTYVNAHTKKKRLAALRKRYDEGRRSEHGDSY